MIGLLAKIVGGLFVLLTLAWTSMAFLYDGPSGAAGKIVAVTYVACVLFLFFKWTFCRALSMYVLCFAAVLCWWLQIPPSNERNWAPEYANQPHVSFSGDIVTVRNVRKFHYRTETDFDQEWVTRTYDLSKLDGLDMFFSYWGSPNIAHTIMSWQFADSLPLSISIETRREVGETYSAVGGFFRQYELHYVAADERDLVGLRTNYRKEDVYLYRLNYSPEIARKLLLDYFSTMNQLVKTPRWYNALLHNCTTTIRQHAQHIAAGKPFNWRLLANGHLPELGYMRGTINNSRPFEEIKQQSFINARAQGNGINDNFSPAIRIGLPDRPGQK